MKMHLALVSVALATAVTLVAFSNESKPEKHDGHVHSADEGHQEKKTAHEDHADDSAKEGETGHSHDKNEAEHDDHEKEHAKGHNEEDAHGGHEDHGEEGGHDEEGGASNIGPEKGVTHANEKLGIRLSAEAKKSFDLQFVTVDAGDQIWVPKASVLRSLEEVNLYRFRDEYFKTIDFQVIRSEGNRLLVTSKDLKPGDSVLSQGVNFVRTAELDAFAGESHGHSH